MGLRTWGLVASETGGCANPGPRPHRFETVWRLVGVPQSPPFVLKTWLAQTEGNNRFINANQTRRLRVRNWDKLRRAHHVAQRSRPGRVNYQRERPTSSNIKAPMTASGVRVGVSWRTFDFDYGSFCD